MQHSEETKRRAVRTYFEGKKRSLPAILIIIGIPLLLFFFIGVILIGIGLFLLFRQSSLTADSQIDQWSQEDYEAHDFVARAQQLAGFRSLVREPILLRGLAASFMGDGVINRSRMGNDGRMRSTPLGATVILCTADQLGIYQTGLDLTTGNRVNERFMEVFYQDVVAISGLASSDSLDTKNHLQTIKASRLTDSQLRLGVTKVKLVENLRQLTERFRSYIVADLLQRDMRKTYRIDFVDGEHVQIPVADGRPTRQANAEFDAEAGGETARAMLALRLFVREKKRAILNGELTTSGELV